MHSKRGHPHRGQDRARGTVRANGQLLSIAQNTALFSLFGTTYGGKTTFARPNLKRAAPKGRSYSICQFGIFP